MGTHWVVKLIDVPAAVEAGYTRDEILREAQMMSQFSSNPHVITTSEVYENETEIAIVMEHYDGGPQDFKFDPITLQDEHKKCHDHFKGLCRKFANDHFGKLKKNTSDQNKKFWDLNGPP